VRAAPVAAIYRRWLRDRRRSTIGWSLGLAGVIGVTAAFYPSLSSDLANLGSSGGAMASLIGLNDGIDPSSPLGFLWTNLYANIVPWVLMALGISLGTASVAGDEEAGTLEYLLSKPVNRTQVVVGRFLASITILFLVAVVSGLALLASAPLFELTTSTTTTAADGSTVTNPGVGLGDIAAGTFAAFAVGVGIGAIAFLIGAATGRRGITLSAGAGIAVAGYLLYTLANVTDGLDFLTWISPWRWYVADAMFINGLDWDVLLPFGLALGCAAIGGVLFNRRDLRS
jgi:beta-exotoxin I transport system permease protein